MRTYLSTAAGVGRKRFAAVVLAVSLGSTMAACGSGSDSKSGKDSVDFNKLSLADLYAGAKKEGTLTLNSGASDDDLKIIAADFNKLYPGIKIKHFEQQGEDSAAKMAAEAKAGVHKTDVLDIDQNTIYAVAQLGLLAKYTPPEGAKFDTRLKKPWYTGYRIQIKPISYNTDKVKGADIPTGYNDLLDPKWKNKICAESDEISVFGNMLDAMGEKAGLAYWKTLHEHGLRLISGQNNVVQALESGDCSIAQSANVHSIAKEMDKGAPVAWVKTDPLYAIAGAIGVAADAPHPYAARLWVNYVLSDRGQQSLVDDYRIPANPAVKPKEKELQTGDYTMVLPTDKMLKDFTKLNNEYYEVTGRPVVGQ
jgi:ABC-type Fe3+ transport system substrate-binding protein